MKYQVIGIIILVISVAIIFGLEYLISISNLPDWFKFFLLK
jgi:hypothetical protein